MADEQKNGKAEEKQPKNRSPVHPLLDLPTAIETADRIREKEGFAFTPVNVILSHLDYSPKSSSGLRTLAALIHYGLAEDTGSGAERRARLTDLAKRILQTRREGAVDRATLREAALNPTIYNKLWGEWLKDGNWPSKSRMEWELRHDHGFNPASIDSFIKDFRATMEYAGLDKAGDEEHIEGDNGGDAEAEPDLFRGARAHPTADRREQRVAAASPERARGPTMATMEHTADHVESLTIPLHRGAMAVLTAPWPLSRENFEALENWLRYAKSLAAPAEPPTAQEQ